MDVNNKYTSKYLDISNEPLYPFGFGLSYTTFEYGEPVLNKKEMTEAEVLTVSIDVKNTGKYKGEEVVQLYIRDLVASVARPVKELKAFQKIELEAGQSKTVTFEISSKELSFYRADMSFGVEKGKFILMIGSNSRDTKNIDFMLN
jgi:beta-glucosidase